MDKRCKDLVEKVNEVNIVHITNYKGCDVVEGTYKGIEFKVVDCGEDKFDVNYDGDSRELIKVLKYMGCIGGIEENEAVYEVYEESEAE